MITDASGRAVLIPKKISSIIALRSGALRLLAYLDATKKVIAVEENEKRRTVPYLFANPQLKELPVVGSGNIAEPELLAAYDPDIILVTYLTAGEADELQVKTGVPVVVLDYANFNERRADLYKTLDILGTLINKEERADSLITFIRNTILDLKTRSNKSEINEKVYIGGIAYRGSHGITSTEPHYAPFSLLGLKNVAGGLGEVTSSPRAWLENAFIDVEQLIEWNPDHIFLDVSGRTLWEQDLQNEALRNSLKALQKKNFYMVLPHNWYTTNYENILCNAYYVGKIMYPENFSDIEIKDKCNEIYRVFLGKPIYDSMELKFKMYKKPW
ncbi:MAG: ABC transporter substrate-binding protein [Bacteroidales bacterium]|nr:ABC transporter substrate-binding protein [Bacteroidales bacterium]MCF8388976.1 ABC transporter substrate-binding protein [Bacteroidales bacterium]MCF8399246.1 ABC transporter substrate-binding protein [Bacteroidales bacterium]